MKSQDSGYFSSFLRLSSYQHHPSGYRVFDMDTDMVNLFNAPDMKRAKWASFQNLNTKLAVKNCAESTFFADKPPNLLVPRTKLYTWKH